jgi:hypothetical protein
MRVSGTVQTKIQTEQAGAQARYDRGSACSVLRRGCPKQVVETLRHCTATKHGPRSWAERRKFSVGDIHTHCANNSGDTAWSSKRAAHIRILSGGGSFDPSLFVQMEGGCA